MEIRWIGNEDGYFARGSDVVSVKLRRKPCRRYIPIDGTCSATGTSLGLVMLIQRAGEGNFLRDGTLTSEQRTMKIKSTGSC